MISRSAIRALVAIFSLQFTMSVLASTSADESRSLQVADDVTLYGEVALADLIAQYPQGVRYIELRTEAEEGVTSTRSKALRLGMRYESIPVAGPELIDEQVAQLEALLNDGGGQQHTVLRCGSGNRAAMMWGATRIDAGEEPDQVMQQLRSMITKPAVEQALRTYAGNRNR